MAVPVKAGNVYHEREVVLASDARGTDVQDRLEHTVERLRPPLDVERLAAQ